MDAREFWTGRGVDYQELWRAFDDGKQGYPSKFLSWPNHLMIIEFEESPNLVGPLFDHEAVYKSIKGLIHDLKQRNFEHWEYNETPPVFLYSVERGSSIYKLLGSLKQLITFAFSFNDKQMQRRQKIIQERIDFLRKNFPSALDGADVEKYIMAKTTLEMDEALRRLMQKGIKSIKISRNPVGQIPNRRPKLIEFKGK